MAENIGFHTGGRHESYWIDDFERVIGEVHYFLLPQDLERSANVNVGEAERLADLALTEWQLNSLVRIDRKTAANPDVELEEQMRDALPGASQTEVCQVIVGARLIGADLSAEQSSEAWIGLDDDIQLLPRKGVHTHYRKAAGGMMHRGVRCRLKPEHRPRQREIHDLAGTVIEQHGERDPAIENNEVCGTDFTLAVELRSDRDDASSCLQIGDRAELSSYRHLVSPLHRRTSRRLG